MGSKKKKPGVVSSQTSAGTAAVAVRAFGIPALRELVAWFNRSRRVLPWREDPSLYRVWISEIMLQQTQVITVLPYFDRFMTAFPTVEKLAVAPEAAVLKAWEGLGYYSRARNLHRAAKAIHAAGDFPRTREGWLEISGVGPYTAGAITSIALGLPEPIVDGNVERVFARLRRLDRATGEANYKAELWELSKRAVLRAHADGLSPSELNQAWMELGATICTPRNPKCELCPVIRECAAKRADVVAEYPTKKKRAEWIHVQESRVALVDLAGGKIYLEQTAKGEWREGLWDFPEILPKVFAEASRKPEILGEFATRHVVTRHKIERQLKVFSWRGKSNSVTAKSAPGRWILLSDPEVAISSAPKKGIRELVERFLA